MMTKRLFLARGREKSLMRRHPWIFSGAVGRLEGKAQPGETIDIFDEKGRWLARGAWCVVATITNSRQGVDLHS